MIPQPNQIEVLVAHSAALSSEALALALQQDPDLQAVGVSPQSLVETAQMSQPHVAILSHMLDQGFETLKELLAVSPKTRVIMLLDEEQPDLVVNSLKCGARGVFCRSHPLKMLIRCIKQVHAGQVWISAAQLDFVLAMLADAPFTPIVDTQGTQLLSRREQEVIHWMANGFSNREIAKAVGISESTAKNYVYRIYNKLGISNRVEAAMYAASRRTAVPAKPSQSISRSSSPVSNMAAGDD